MITIVALFSVLRPCKICVQCHKILISIRFLHNTITKMSDCLIIVHVFIPKQAIWKRLKVLFLVARKKRTEVQRAQVICPVSYNSMTGPEIKHSAEKPPEKIFCLFRILHLCIRRWMVDRRRKTRKGQNSMPRRREKF